MLKYLCGLRSDQGERKGCSTAGTMGASKPWS